MKYSLLLLLLTFCFSCTTTSEEEIQSTHKNDINEISWVIDTGFVHPESVIYAEDSTFFYISNIGTDESDEHPNGFISKVSVEGKIVELKWVDSIQSPKGQCLANGNYYVSALDELLEIDVNSGTISNRYTTPEVTFLNDVTADQWGNIYVSGMRENAIYRLDTTGNFSLWFQNDSLHHPNGLLAVNDKLFIGGWGNMDQDEPNIDSVGHLMVIDTHVKTLQYITEGRPGKLDGIQLANATGKQLIVSSWKAGEIFLMDEEGNVEKITDTPTSVGDILYDYSKNLIIAPLNFQHRVEAFHLN